jgi:hypothetical protein
MATAAPLAQITPQTKHAQEFQTMKGYIAKFMTAALAVGLLASNAQARGGGGGFGGGHGGGVGGGFHGGIMTGRSAFVGGGNRFYNHGRVYGYPLGCSPAYVLAGQQQCD